MYSWASRLTRCLELGVIDETLLPHLDAIITWYAGINDPDDEFSASLLDVHGESALRMKFEEFLDRLVIAEDDDSLMFPKELTTDKAKKRYRQLIRVFHPDRGVKDQIWLNYRAEKINLAYERYSHGEGDLFEDTVVSVTPDYTDAVRFQNESNNKPGNFKFKYRANTLRRRFGDPKKLQRKIVFSLAGVSVVWILFLYASTREFMDDISFSKKPLTGELKASNQPILKTETPSQFSLENQRMIDEAPWLELESLEDELSLVDDSEVDTIEASDEEVASLKTLDLLSVEDDASSLKSNETALQSEPLINNECIEPKNNLTNQQGIILQVKVSHLRLRSGPGSDCKMRHTLLQDDEVKILRCAEDNRWCYVELVESGSDNHLYGWVNQKYLGATIDKSVSKTVVTSDIATQRDTNNSMSAKIEEEPSNEIAGQKQRNSTTKPELPIYIAPEVIKMLREYEKYFETGNLVGISGLYMSSARENHLRGADKITNYYRRFFKYTLKRELNLEVFNVKQEDAYSAIITGSIAMGRSAASNGKWYDDDADFRVVIVKTGSAYKIASFDWAIINKPNS